MNAEVVAKLKCRGDEKYRQPDKYREPTTGAIGDHFAGRFLGHRPKSRRHNCKSHHEYHRHNYHPTHAIALTGANLGTGKNAPGTNDDAGGDQAGAEGVVPAAG